MDVCMQKNTRVLNPIVDWSDEDVWEFLRWQGCEGNPLYQCGYKRIGCIGCPQAYYKERLRDFERYPSFKRMYLSAFSKMLENLDRPSSKWKTPEDVFNWWIYSDKIRSRDIDGQLEF